MTTRTRVEKLVHASNSVHHAETIAAIGEWKLEWEGSADDPPWLICTVPDDCTDTLRAVVRVWPHGSARTEYGMYKTVPGDTGTWSVRRADTAESWGLDGTTGELKCEEATVSPAMTYAYAAVLEMCDRSGDWRDLVVQLCWLCIREGDYYLNVPSWITDLSPTAGMVLVRFLDELLREQDERQVLESAVKGIGLIVRELLVPKDTVKNPSVMAALLQERASAGYLVRLIAGSIEKIGEILTSVSSWRFPKGSVFSSPVARDLLKPLVEEATEG